VSATSDGARAAAERGPLTRKWTQRQVAEACGLTQGMVACIENYRRVPARESLERLINVTGLPAEALVLPGRFLSEHPDFLTQPSTAELPRRGRRRNT
jgi:transcriptional regulator with XRE-family HTH domain